MRWKLLGLAGFARLAATGALVARKRRAHHNYGPDELRERLHRRLAEVSAEHAELAEPPRNTVAPPVERDAD